MSEPKYDIFAICQMKKIAAYYPGILFFTFALLVGMLTYQDYGLGWDEPAQHLIGTVNYNYAFGNDNTLLTFYDKEYGAGFELPLIILEKVMHIADSRDIYLMRHLVAHIFFLLSMFVAYLFLLRLFKNQFIACIGFAMLVFSPRIYAHSFYNTKDIPFMCMVLISLLLSQVAFARKRPSFFFLVGAALGYTTGIRIMGIMPAAIILAFLLGDLVFSPEYKKKPKKIVATLGLFIIGFCALIYASCPYFWSSPVQHFGNCLSKMAGKGFCGYDLINGNEESSARLPWYYLPEWIAITTPALWVTAGVAGIILFVVTFAGRPISFLKNTNQRNILLCFLCFMAPLTTVIVMHSVVYDEWRHLYFIYPAFVVMALYAINFLLQSRLKIVTIVACLLQVTTVGIFMVGSHPQQQVYFNSFVPHSKEYLRNHFEMDYWGCSIRMALNHLIRSDPRPVIKVANLDFGPCVENNLLLLPANDRKRFQPTSEADADYLITTFRGHRADFDYHTTAYEFKVLNSAIIKVYKR